MTEIDEDGVEIAGYDVTVDVDDWRSMRAEIERLRAALREIKEQDIVEIALDPEWPRRVANAALIDKEAGDD